jgi:hypothetical protein
MRTVVMVPGKRAGRACLVAINSKLRHHSVFHVVAMDKPSPSSFTAIQR